jgi:DNA-binding MurR/RpiR family transcriptional regulator
MDVSVTLHQGVRACLARIRSAAETGSESSRQVARFILANPQAAIRVSVREIAESADVSVASVIRFAQQLGYAGVMDLRLDLAGELSSGMVVDREPLSRDDNSTSIIPKIVAHHQQVARETGQLLNPQDLADATRLIVNARHREVYGVGSSGFAAETLALSLSRTGLPATARTDAHIQALTAVQLGSGDLVIVVSRGGETKDIIWAARVAREAGVHVIAITTYGQPPLAQYAHVCLYHAASPDLLLMPYPGAQAAQLVVIDALVTAVAISRYQEALEAVNRAHRAVSRKLF